MEKNELINRNNLVINHLSLVLKKLKKQNNSFERIEKDRKIILNLYLEFLIQKYVSFLFEYNHELDKGVFKTEFESKFNIFKNELKSIENNNFNPNSSFQFFFFKFLFDIEEITYILEKELINLFSSSENYNINEDILNNTILNLINLFNEIEYSLKYYKDRLKFNEFMINFKYAYEFFENEDKKYILDEKQFEEVYKKLVFKNFDLSSLNNEIKFLYNEYNSDSLNFNYYLQKLIEKLKILIDLFILKKDKKKFNLLLSKFLSYLNEKELVLRQSQFNDSDFVYVNPIDNPRIIEKNSSKKLTSKEILLKKAKNSKNKSVSKNTQAEINEIKINSLDIDEQILESLFNEFDEKKEKQIFEGVLHTLNLFHKKKIVNLDEEEIINKLNKDNLKIELKKLAYLKSKLELNKYYERQLKLYLIRFLLSQKELNSSDFTIFYSICKFIILEIKDIQLDVIYLFYDQQDNFLILFIENFFTNLKEKMLLKNEEDKKNVNKINKSIRGINNYVLNYFYQFYNKAYSDFQSNLDERLFDFQVEEKLFLINNFKNNNLDELLKTFNLIPQNVISIFQQVFEESSNIYLKTFYLYLIKRNKCIENIKVYGFAPIGIYYDLYLKLVESENSVVSKKDEVSSLENEKKENTLSPQFIDFINNIEKSFSFQQEFFLDISPVRHLKLRPLLLNYLGIIKNKYLENNSNFLEKYKLNIFLILVKLIGEKNIDKIKNIYEMLLNNSSELKKNNNLIINDYVNFIKNLIRNNDYLIYFKELDAYNSFMLFLLNLIDDEVDNYLIQSNGLNETEENVDLNELFTKIENPIEFNNILQNHLYEILDKGKNSLFKILRNNF